MSQQIFGNGEPPRDIIRGSGNGEPPRGPVHGSGNGEPPRSNLSARLSAYLDAESPDRDPLIYAGLDALRRHLHEQCGTPSVSTEAAPAPEVEMTKRRQSRRNRAFTSALELARHAEVSESAGRVSVKLKGVQPWSDTPLTGEQLTAQAAATMILSTTSEADKRIAEIVSQANAIELLFALELGLSAAQHPRTIDLIELASAAIAAPLYEAKRLADVARPSELISGSAPRIPVPGHASFPSGHATASHALAALLKVLCRSNSQRSCRLDALAARLADNRRYAGLHTVSDTEAGAALGQAVGAWLATKARDSIAQWREHYDEAAREWP